MDFITKKLCFDKHVTIKIYVNLSTHLSTSIKGYFNKKVLDLCSSYGLINLFILNISEEFLNHACQSTCRCLSVILIQKDKICCYI